LPKGFRVRKFRDSAGPVRLLREEKQIIAEPEKGECRHRFSS
jgi:hypothetical protein